MSKIKVMLGFDMETDIGSWTPWYDGLVNGTPVILDILKKHEISATFYFTGDSCKKHPEVTLSVKDAGHEIGCHTLFHETIGESLFEIPGMVPVLPHEVEPRIKLATEWVEEVAGVRPVSFRCPRLFGSTTVTNALENLGYLTDATYPMYYFKKQLVPYHPSSDDWTETGDMKLLELPNFADLSMDSQDEYGRDMDQWPLFRTESADKVMEHINGYVSYCEKQGVEPFLCFYFHPWEFWPMPEGLLHYGEGAVLPDPFIIKNCGEYGAQQFELLVEKLKAIGAEFYQAKELA
jgi:peptidoglycan-N-acetylglucosamine deacetylase